MRVGGGDGTGNDGSDDAGPRAGARMLRGAANMGSYQSSTAGPGRAAAANRTRGPLISVSDEARLRVLTGCTGTIRPRRPRPRHES
jgi:hypothetical protein